MKQKKRWRNIVSVTLTSQRFRWRRSIFRRGRKNLRLKPQKKKLETRCLYTWFLSWFSALLSFSDSTTTSRQVKRLMLERNIHHIVSYCCTSIILVLCVRNNYGFLIQKVGPWMGVQAFISFCDWAVANRPVLICYRKNNQLKQNFINQKMNGWGKLK